MICSMWQIQEKWIEQYKPLYQVLADLSKALDTINRVALWKILTKIGCPSIFLNMVKETYRLVLLSALWWDSYWQWSKIGWHPGSKTII